MATTDSASTIAIAVVARMATPAENADAEELDGEPEPVDASDQLEF